MSGENRFCEMCGTAYQLGSKFCIGCGSELALQGKNLGHQVQIVPSTPSALFDSQILVVYFHWSFAENKNAKILTSDGKIVAEISRELVPNGIRYSIIDSQTNETLSIDWIDETHIDIMKDSQRLSQIEIRKVKETIELKDFSDNIEIWTEKSDFIIKKSIYEKDEEIKEGNLKPLAAEKIPEHLPKNNLYELEIRRLTFGMRKLLVFALFNLIYFRSNPIR